MEHFISAAVNSLADFLNHKKTATDGELLVSFIYPSPEIFNEPAVDEILTNQDHVFIFEKPEEEYKFLAFSKAAEVIENGSQRFSTIDKKVREYKNKFFNNWDTFPVLNIPLFIGGVEFPADHSDNTWKNFHDSLWIIPEMILFAYKKKSYIIFNSSAPAAAIKNLTARYKKILSSILSPVNKKSPAKLIPNSAAVQMMEGNSPKDKKRWKNQVNEITEEIASGNIQKAVLSRKVELVFHSEINFPEILGKLAERFPGCCIFLYRNNESVFFGASPERLLKFENVSVEFDIMAGSAPRGKTAEEDASLERNLLSSSKNMGEHGIVVDYINNSVKPFTEELSISETGVKKYSNIQHLWTKVEARLKEGSSVLHLAKAVYPSPSICGMPKEEALSFIKKTEGFKRGLYSGVIGWMNFNAGEFIIAIRSALYQRRKLAIFAGSGIVQDSIADDEWKETELKLNPILSLFYHENKN